MIEMSKHFEAFLRTRGLKMTWERNLILIHIMARPDHFTIEDLIKSFEVPGQRISRATIYRTVGLLEEASFVKSFSPNGELRIFEKTKKHHDHLVCTRCGKIIEFFNPEIEALQDIICAKEEFTPANHELIIHGLCGVCSSSGSTDKKTG